jgi:RNA polymerase-binding transcription factor DksA
VTQVATAKKTAPAVPTTAAPTPAAATDLSAPELADIRAELAQNLADMTLEYQRSLAELDDLQRSNTDGAGDDQADVGSKTFEREQEQSIAANRHDLLLQTERAIARIDSGTYGLCEECGRPIPNERLKAIPMATLDAVCKARLERR